MILCIFSPFKNYGDNVTGVNKIDVIIAQLDYLFLLTGEDRDKCLHL